MATYLEEYIESVASLPQELRRNFALIRDLDQQSQEVQSRIQKQCVDQLEEILQSTSDDGMSLEWTLDVENEQKSCLDIADRKVQLAITTYDLVDNHIRKLDRDLRKFEEELKQERDLLRGAGPEQKQASQGGAKVQQQEVDPSKAGRRKGAVTTQAPPTTPGALNMDLDLPVDPNEPTYCYCNQVSFGEMVACDNPDCRIEWFHYECVGLEEPPKGKWYCPDCQVVVKRRKVLK